MQVPALVGCVDVCRVVKLDVHSLVGVQRRGACMCMDTVRMCAMGHPRRLLKQEADP